MRFLEKLSVIERVDQLIKMKATGSARDLAKRLNLSKSTVYELLDVMRAMGAEITYCTSHQSYYYEKEVVLSLGFIEKARFNGGKSTHMCIVSSFSGHNTYIFGL